MTVDLPTPILVTRHQCPHCRRTWAKKTAATEHLGRCWKNPANHACKTCAHHQEERRSSHQCIPGRDCGCDSWPEACCHEDGPEPLERPITNCPLWELHPRLAARD